MKKKPKIEYNGIKFDSKEELLFYYYLEELKEAGFVKHFEYNTKSFILSEPVKYTWLEKKITKEVEKQSTLLHDHVYTPDYYIEWNQKAKGIFYQTTTDKVKLDKIPFIGLYGLDEDYKTVLDTSYIEIKPEFDFKNMTRLAVINQKWLMAKWDLYVQKIIPTGKKKSCLFAKTFVPNKALLTEKTKKPKKFKYPVKSLKEFINGKK